MKRVNKIIHLLRNQYGRSHVFLKAKKPVHSLVATILSAQCTDEQVNKVTPLLFRKYNTAEDFANAKIHELERMLYSTGFYKNKAKNIKASCRKIMKYFNGRVPKTMKEMITLPGGGRKTTNVILADAFNITSGIVVDTHVRRLSLRLGLTENKNPDKIENDLMKIVFRNLWKEISFLLISHGRTVCTARKPKCRECVLNKICPSAFGI